jgi:multidrug efflux system membrane fusion protein
MSPAKQKYWLIAALLPVLWLSCHSVWAADSKGEKPKNPPAAVTVMPATLRTVSETIKSLGTVVPFQSVALNARIDSQVVDVKFKAGDFVKKGQPLFILDDRSLKAELAQAQAALQANRAQIDSLKKQYDRLSLGAEKGFASEASRDDAKAALDERKALVLSDEAAVDNIKVQLGYTVIVSPIDGRTGTINVTPGNTVRANDTAPLVTINQIRPVSVQAALPQSSFDAVRTALQKGEVAVLAVRDGSKSVSQGTLAYIDNNVDAASGTFAVRATFPNEDEQLWPGMLANITVNIGNGVQAITVPEVAIQNDTDGSFVYVAENDKAVKRPVGVSRIQDRQALVVSGLREGEQVIVDGMMSLKDGSPVKAGKNAPAKTQ